MTQALHRATRGFLAIAAVLLVAASVLVASPASAHDRLIGSDPAAGSTVDVSPDQLTLTFSAAIATEPGASEVQVTDAAGTQLAGDPTVDGALLIVPLTSPGSGAVTVLWKVVSSDGHPISGEYSFTIAAAPVSPEPTNTATTEPEPTETATTEPVETSEPDDTATPLPGPPMQAVDMTPWIIGGVVLVLAVIGAVIYLVTSRNRRRAATETGSDDPAER